MNGNPCTNSIQAGSWSFRSRFHQYRYFIHSGDLFGLEYPYVYGAQKQNDTKSYSRRLHLFVCYRLRNYRRALSALHFERLGGWCGDVSDGAKQYFKSFVHSMALFHRREKRHQSRLQKAFQRIYKFLVRNARQGKNRQQ